ncbi:MAG TPA: substrate-binding domain-containing protein [Micromonosporaceae bacterium]
MTHRYRRVAGAALAALLAVGLAACGSSTSGSSGGTSAKASDIRVGGIIWGRYLDYWRLVQLGMEAAAKQYHVQIQIGTSDKNLGTEAQVVSQMQARGVNVLAISPFSADGSKATLTRAGNSMTVVQYNTQVNDPSLKYFVGVTNAQLGKTIGEAAKDYINKQMGGKATIGTLSNVQEPGGKERLDGFLSVVQTMPGVKVVADATAAKPAEGASAFPTLIQGHPDINLVFGWNGGALEGAATAAAKMNTKVALFGIDLSKTEADMMLGPNSPIVAVADQHAFQLGFKAVELGIKAHQGQSVDPVIHLDPTVYSVSDKSGIQQWEQQQQQAANEK